MTLDSLQRTLAAFDAQPKPPDYMVESADGTITCARFPAGMERKPRTFPQGSMVFTTQANYDRVRAAAAPVGMNDPALVTGTPMYLVSQAEADEFLMELKWDILAEQGRRLLAQPVGGMQLLP